MGSLVVESKLRIYLNIAMRLKMSFLAMALLCLGAEADDAFVCCMGGWKEIHGTVLCSAPCYPGYVEKVERPPLLSPLVFCRKLGMELDSLIAGMYKHY